MTRKSHLQAETKTEGIYKRLRTLAFEKGPDAQMPTFRTLCDELETTRVTLGEVLDILEAENILYRKERQGIFVSPHIYHKVISILFNSSTLSGYTMSPFWNMLWLRLEQEVKGRAFYRNELCSMHMVPTQVDRQHPFPEEIMNRVSAGRIDGILSIGLAVPTDGRIADRAVPCVCFAASGPWIVQLDGAEIGRQAARTLLGQGCERIGFWLPYWEHAPLDIETSQEIGGMREVLSEHNTSFYPSLMRQLLVPPAEGTQRKALSHQEQGYLLAYEIFGNDHPLRPDGLFIGDDLMTDGVLVAFEELHITVGKDVQVVTQGNVGSPILFGRTKNMTVFEYDVHDIVQALFSVLDALVYGQDEPEHVTWIRPHLRQKWQWY